MNDAGRIGFVIRDDYDNTVQYDFLDVVYYHGNSYVAKKLTLGNIPNENNEYWHILAAGGVRVKGDAETEYRDGDVNITKENIGLGNVENKSSETIRGEITSENITNALDYTPTNTKVKGNAETEYRTGEVNLTPENIGAIDKNGDTVEGQLVLEKGSINYEISGLKEGAWNSSETGNKAYLKIMNIKCNTSYGGQPISFSINMHGFGVLMCGISPNMNDGNIGISWLNADISLVGSDYWKNLWSPYLCAKVKSDNSIDIYVKILKGGYRTFINNLAFNNSYYSVNTTKAVTASDIIPLAEVTESNGYKFCTIVTPQIMQGATSTAAGKAGLVPAPGVGYKQRYLNAVGEWQGFSGFTSTNSVGWKRIVKIPVDEWSNRGKVGILLLSRAFNNTNNESYIISLSTIWQNKMTWKCITSSANTKILTKLRISKVNENDVDNFFLEVYYNSSEMNDMSYRLVSDFVRDFEYVSAINATENETVVSEYTIPDKDDFDTSKSLTRFEEIPSEADLNSEKYMQAGNYAVTNGAITPSLLNSPINDNGSTFRLTVYRYSNAVEQVFTPFRGNKPIIIRSGLYPFSGSWLYTRSCMSYVGTPPANKLWGTDANGNVGWQSIPNKAASHNAIFRGKDLTNVYTIDQICSRIANGTFDDLYIGDYFDITISTSYTSSETVRCILAGFDTYWNNGDTAFTKHHAVVVPKNCFTKAHAMNSSNTTVGAYAGSNMWTTVLPVYKTALQAKFGNHLLMHRTLLTKTMNANLDSNAGAGFKGASTEWEWYDTYLSLLSEIQLYGSNVWSSSGYDTGCENLQLPLFALDPTAKVCTLGGTGDGRYWYWLRNVASSTSFACCSNFGYSNYYGASYGSGVRPLFCIG